MKLTYLKYKESLFSKEARFEYIKAKKLVTSRKKNNIKIKWNKNMQKIDELFRLDKQKFWKQIKKMQNSCQNIEIDIKTILEGYKKLFTTEKLTLTELNETKLKLQQQESNTEKIEVKINKTKLDQLLKKSSKW